MLKRTVITAAVLAFSATAAQAQDVSGYLQGSLGYAEAQNFKDVKQDFKDVDDSDMSYKFIVGVQLNRFIALEAQYTDLGKLKIKHEEPGERGKFEAKNRGFGGNLVGTLPIQDTGITLFAKAGLHRIKTSVSINGQIDDVLKFSGKGSTKETVTSYGGGLSYNINEALTVVADYERYRKLADIKDYHIDVASVGLRYNF